MTASTRIWTNVDLDADGEVRGYLSLPLAVHDTSNDDAGYSYTALPIVSLRNGEGPRGDCVFVLGLPCEGGS